MQESLLVQGADIISLFCRLTIHAKKELPLRSSEIGLLIYTVKETEPVTPLKAADYFKVSKPMIATMVKRLVAAGYLEKKPSTEDKRSYILQPTAAATQLTETVYDEYFKDMQLLLNSLGTEKFKELLALLEEANAALLQNK